MELHIAPSQIQTISPQLAQAMEVLQMNALELKAYLEDMAQENPVIELAEATASDEGAIALHKLQWLENRKQEIRERSGASWEPERDEDALNNVGKHSSVEDSLEFFLKAQMYALRLPKDTEAAVNWLIDNLDGNGWYRSTGESAPFPPELTSEALEIVRQMEPPGVGASGLKDCLLLQLDRLEGDWGTEKEIVGNYLEDLGRDHYNLISKKLGIPQERVRRACDVIRSLNPRPGADFDSGEEAEYIRPDIIVTDMGDHFEISLAERSVPEMHMNSYYCRLAKESDDPKVRDYLGNKARQAKWLLQNIEQRRSTVLRCVEVILDWQQAFFREGGRLQPMTLKDVAGRVEMHESTVSRAARGKYLQCARGVFPLSHFFSRSLGGETGEAVTQDAAKELLKRLIDGEDKARPLSDQKLCELMAAEAVEISRRTVAKYRLELGIPSATGRRRL